MFIVFDLDKNTQTLCSILTIQMWIVAATAAGTEALLPKHKNVKFK